MIGVPEPKDSDYGRITTFAPMSWFARACNEPCIMFFDEVEIIVQNPLSIPNTITPNNDGFNDTWRIGNISNYPSAQVSIFDRWGQSVFKVTGYTPDKRWNGTNNGLRIPSGTYFYIIELRVGETTKIYNGSINVIR